MTSIETELVKIVLNNTFSLVTLAWSSGLAWWLSSSVLIFTLLSKLYPSKQLMRDNNLFVPVGILTSFFVLSLIVFGCVVVYDLSVLETNVYKIFSDNISGYCVPDVSNIFGLVRKLYVIVTTTLFLFLIAWLYLWFSDSKPSSTIIRP